MEKIKDGDCWEELTSHPEILKKIPQPIPGWGEEKSYCVGILPGEGALAKKVAEMIGQPVVFAESQNLSLASVEGNVLFLACSPNDDLGMDEVLLLGKKIYPEWRPFELSMGDVYMSPDGKKWLVRGREGDPQTTSSMRFEPLSDEGLERLRAQMGRENKKS